jgi:ribosomal protein S18 acetylase RimI-like enzyme
MTGYRIRLLDRSDEPVFRPVRLDALRLNPTAFGRSYEEEVRSTPDDLCRRLLEHPSYMFGGFASAGELVGVVGLRLETGIKSRHKGLVFTVYVDAAHRRAGLARALVEAAIAHARDAGLRVLHLTVTIGNDGARKLYRELGFRTYGVEPRGLCLDGVFFDEELMALDLDREGA